MIGQRYIKNEAEQFKFRSSTGITNKTLRKSKNFNLNQKTHFICLLIDVKVCALFQSFVWDTSIRLKF